MTRLLKTPILQIPQHSQRHLEEAIIHLYKNLSLAAETSLPDSSQLNFKHTRSNPHPLSLTPFHQPPS